MMRLRWSVLAALMAGVFLLGFGFRSLVAQQSAGTLQSTQVLPPDVLPGSLARIPWSTKEDCCPLNSEEERQAFAKSRATAENPKKPASIGLGGMRAYFPLYARTYGETHRWLDKEGNLEPRHVELAMVVASREMGAGGYREWFIHSRAARREGVSDEILEVVRTQKETRGLDPKDAAVIEFSREMVRGPKVTSKTFADTERLFGRRGTLVISFQVARYAGLALGTRAYDIQLQPGQTAPWPEP